jgi:hypothetical protein
MAAIVILILAQAVSDVKCGCLLAWLLALQGIMADFSCALVENVCA